MGMDDQSVELERSSAHVEWNRRRSVLKTFLLFACFFAVALALHFPGFRSAAIYDTEMLLLGNTHYFSRHDFAGVIGVTPQRPLFMASLYLNYLLTGMDVRSFRIVNAAILAAAGLGLTWLISILLEICSLTRQLCHREKCFVSIVMGLLFVVHPLQKLVVLYVWQREAIMSCFFYYSALAAYLTGRSRTHGSEVRWYAITALLILCGITSKENLMSLPVVAIVSEWILFRKNLRHQIRQSLTIVLIVAVPFLIHFLLVHALQQPDTPPDHEGILNRLHAYYDKVEITFPEIVLTESRVWFSYLLGIVAPFAQATQLLRSETISRSLSNPPLTAVAALGIAALVGTALAMTKKRPLSALGILFFLITLAPESLLIPQYLFCGYRAILPMAGVLMVFADVLVAMLSSPRKRLRQLAVAMPLLLVAGFSIVTFSQAKRWNPFSFWQEAYADLPEYTADVERYPYADVLSSYAIELGRSGQYAAAIELFKQAAELSADRSSDKQALARGNLAITLIRSGKADEGIAYLRELVRLYPHSAWQRYNLGVALVNAGKTEEGVRFIREAVNLAPEDAAARVALGRVLLAEGQTSEALAHLEKAASIADNDAEVYYQLGRAYARAGRKAEALTAFDRALAINPDHPGAKRDKEDLARKAGSTR